MWVCGVWCVVWVCGVGVWCVVWVCGVGDSCIPVTVQWAA